MNGNFNPAEMGFTHGFRGKAIYQWRSYSRVAKELTNHLWGYDGIMGLLWDYYGDIIGVVIGIFVMGI